MMLSKNVETLKNMNGSTSKYAKWYVRIIDPKIIDYTFQAKGEQIKAQKFECVLVSADPAQYMLGVVPFEFSDREAASKAQKLFTELSVWEVKTPTFDVKARPEYNGCPIKSVMLLKKPTSLTFVPPTNTAELKYPANGLEVALSISGIMAKLEVSTGRYGGNKTFDFCAKFLRLSEQKKVTKGGTPRNVSEAEFVDQNGGTIKASFWEEADAMMRKVPVGRGVLILGCNAMKENNDLKLHIWPSAHLSTLGDQAQTLSSLDEAPLQTKLLTASFTPGQDLEGLVQGEAHPTCAVALADAVASTSPITFQINRCMLEVPMQPELILSQSGRPFIKNCRLRDRTGGVDVDVVRSAVLFFYGCTSEEKLQEHIAAQSLTSVQTRVNVRGVIRAEAGVTRRYVVLVENTPLTGVVSMSAMHLVLGLSKISADGVLAAPAERLVDEPMLGMGLKRDQDEPLGVFRVLLLVEGSKETTIETLDDKLPMDGQTFKISSPNVRCLLSDTAVTMTLQGYCDFKKMMTYRLDKEIALVVASAITEMVPGPASTSDDDRFMVTVEHMQKVSKDEKTLLVQSLGQEWKSVLTDVSSGLDGNRASPVSSKSEGYWSSERTPKVRRLVSEPQSPFKTN